MTDSAQIHMRVSDERKRALRILAAENGFADLTAYVMHVLETCTPMDERAFSLANSGTELDKNVPEVAVRE